MSEFGVGVICGICLGVPLVTGVLYLIELVLPTLPDEPKEQ